MDLAIARGCLYMAAKEFAFEWIKTHELDHDAMTDAILERMADWPIARGVGSGIRRTIAEQAAARVIYVEQHPGFFSISLPP